jgi:hypothetical protein
MLVVFVRCGYCGDDHRGMLTTRGDHETTMSANGTLMGNVRCWRILPDPHRAADEKPSVIPEQEIPARRVFRIVDDTEQAEQVTTARPREKVDARCVSPTRTKPPS